MKKILLQRWPELLGAIVALGMILVPVLLGANFFNVLFGEWIVLCILDYLEKERMISDSFAWVSKKSKALFKRSNIQLI